MSVANHLTSLPEKPDGSPWLTEFRWIYAVPAEQQQNLIDLWMLPQEFKKEDMSGDHQDDEIAERWEEIHDALKAIGPGLPTYDPTCYRRVSAYYSAACRMVAILKKYGTGSPWT
jgi:hypothetical protein